MIDANARPHGTLSSLRSMSCHWPSERSAFAVNGSDSNDASVCTMEAAIAHEVEPYLHTAPNAVAASKALARALGPRIDDAVIEDTIRRLADTWEGEEAAHGIDAFLTKTKARWA